MPIHLFEDNDFLTNLFNAIPFPLMVVDNDLRIFFWNSAALRLIGKETVYREKTGNSLYCIHSMDSEDGCGHGEYCRTCVVKNSVAESGKGKKIYRKRTVMELEEKGKKREIPMLITTSPFEYENKKLTLLMLEDINELLQVGGLLPICSNCKKVRTGQDRWQSIEGYIKTHIVDLEFTHGMCPDCLKELYPKYAKGADN
jgi:PAS domain-containing protein